MRIPSRDVPQADVLTDVVKVVEGVSQGERTFQGLSRYINKVERQGRYYRRAAEILGFVENRANDSTLTTLGRQFISSRPDERRRILAQAVLTSRMMQRVIPLLESKGQAGVSRREIEQFIHTVTADTGPTMIPRRAWSVLSWLLEIGMVVERGSRYVLTGLPEGVEIVDYTDDDEPLFPRKYDLSEYKELSENIRARGKDIAMLVDEAKRDRATSSHRMLTNMMARKIREAGAVPKRNRMIDLSARVRDRVYLFEMKSTTEDNALEQIRRGVSQLYEYRYIHQIDDPALVLVLENPLPKDHTWLIDYLLADRHIFPVWDGDRKTFRCPDRVKADLRFIF